MIVSVETESRLQTARFIVNHKNIILINTIVKMPIEVQWKGGFV